MSARFFPKASLVPASIPDDGMHVELHAGGAAIVATFGPDPDGSIRVVFHTALGDLALPLAEVERAIEFAKREVHDEAYYDSSSDGAA